MTDDAMAWLRAQIEGDLSAATIISNGGFAPEHWDTDPPGQVNPDWMPEAAAITLIIDPDADDPAFRRREYWTALVCWEKENHEPEDARVRETDMPVAIVNNGRRELDHIRRHDPRDVVADCEAKLAILDEHERAVSAARARKDAYTTWALGERLPPRPVAVGPESKPIAGLEIAIRHVASGYRHRQGYAEHWAQPAG